MLCMDLKIGKPGAQGKTFWRTIGTVFVADDANVCGDNNKPATFVIDYPATNGIIVYRDEKEE